MSNLVDGEGHQINLKDQYTDKNDLLSSTFLIMDLAQSDTQVTATDVFFSTLSGSQTHFKACMWLDGHVLNVTGTVDLPTLGGWANFDVA